ncbi:hypothetical protein N2152v2_000202 [Parachlorella kessleri]
MVRDLVVLREGEIGAEPVQLGVQLLGTAAAPVRVQLSLALQDQQNSTAWLEAESEAWLTPTELSWGANQTGVQFVRLRTALELLTALDVEDGLLMVRLGGASNADIQPERDSTLLTMDQSDPAAQLYVNIDTPVFGFVPDIVAYPPTSSTSGSSSGGGRNSSSGAVQIPVQLVSGHLSEPATVLYIVSLLTPAQQQFLPSRALAGFLFFDPNTTTQHVSLPVVWSRVPPDAEYRLGLELQGILDVLIQNQTDAVAVHLFGVAQGTCPPGTALAGAAVNGSVEAAQQQGQTGSARQSNPSFLIGVEDFFLALDGKAVRLSLDAHNRSYGAMVAETAENVTLCVKNAKDLITVKVSNEQQGTANRLAGSTAQKLCGCGLQANSSVVTPAAAGGAEDSCSYLAWQLVVLPGQNKFDMAFTTMVTSGRSVSSKTEQYSLAVVRRADPSHAQLASVTLRYGNHSMLLCGNASGNVVSILAKPSWNSSEGPDSGVVTFKMEEYGSPAPPAAEETSSGAGSSGSSTAGGRVDAAEQSLQNLLELGDGNGTVLQRSADLCAKMSYNVSYDAGLMLLTPTLLVPTEGVRVEVNGQVLSRGSDLAASQAEDTTAPAVGSTMATNSEISFLPAAFFMKLKPGAEIDIQVVVIAEDGVTSNSYLVALHRLPSAPAVASQQGAAAASSISVGSSGNSSGKSSVEAVKYEAPVSLEEQQRRGWPTPPAREPVCTICPTGWASGAINASSCTMCPPGTYAAEAQSTACLPCKPGSYAYSWGSSACKHCIAGTYAPEAESFLCRMCPANWTNTEDGQAACGVRATPAVDYSQRYAVLVSFNVVLSGLDPQEVVIKSGVDGPMEQLVGSLLQSDTASAFNISLQDVAVETTSRTTSSRRVLQANVTAALGVDLPAGATEDDIAAALEVQKLSADKPMELLSQDPDRFFGRTTQTLDVTVQSGTPAAVEHWPDNGGPLFNPLFLLLPGAAALVVGTALVVWACRLSPRCRAWWADHFGTKWRRWWVERGARSGALSAWQLPAVVVRGLGRNAQRYVRYAS